MPALPQHAATHADQRTDRGGERNRVVGVDDALPEAEHEPGDEEPSAPEDERGTHAVGAREPAAPCDAGDEKDQCRGQQPRDLRAELRTEHACDAGRAPHSGLTTRATDTAGLVARQPAEAVVAEDEIEDAVALRVARAEGVGRAGGCRDPVIRRLVGEQLQRSCRRGGSAFAPAAS